MYKEGELSGLIFPLKRAIHVSVDCTFFFFGVQFKKTFEIKCKNSEIQEMDLWQKKVRKKYHLRKDQYLVH